MIELRLAAKIGTNIAHCSTIKRKIKFEKCGANFTRVNFICMHVYNVGTSFVKRHKRSCVKLGIRRPDLDRVDSRPDAAWWIRVTEGQAGRRKRIMQSVERRVGRAWHRQPGRHRGGRRDSVESVVLAPRHRRAVLLSQSVLGRRANSVVFKVGCVRL
jgi:hypothetical protein